MDARAATDANFIKLSFVMAPAGWQNCCKDALTNTGQLQAAMWMLDAHGSSYDTVLFLVKLRKHACPINPHHPFGNTTCCFLFAVFHRQWYCCFCSRCCWWDNRFNGGAWLMLSMGANKLAFGEHSGALKHEQRQLCLMTWVFAFNCSGAAKNCEFLWFHLIQCVRHDNARPRMTSVKI